MLMVGMTMKTYTHILQKLCVLQSGPSYNSEGGLIIKEAPTTKQVLSNTKTMINLGYYIKAKEIITLGEEFKKRLKT